METRTISVIIPTLQKDKTTLTNLVTSLVKDIVVKEIIIIDNSLKGFNFNNEKVRVIIPKENLFVNPSWNLGTKEAKSEYICLANDDIIIPENLCTNVLNEISDRHGIIGANPNYVINTSYQENNTNSTKITLDKIKYERPFNFGIIMFLKKNTYKKIPNDLKIFYGDDWLFYQAEKMKKTNAIFSGVNIYHIGSLSSGKYSDLLKQEGKKYWDYIIPWYKRFLSYMDTKKHLKIYILGFTINIRKKS